MGLDWKIYFSSKLLIIFSVKIEYYIYQQIPNFDLSPPYSSTKLSYHKNLISLSFSFFCPMNSDFYFIQRQKQLMDNVVGPSCLLKNLKKVRQIRTKNYAKINHAYPSIISLLKQDI